MRTWCSALLVVSLLATGCGAASPESTSGPGVEPVAGPGWERLPDPPLSGRVRAVVTAVGDRLLVVGGQEWLCPPNADCVGPEEPAHRDGAILDLVTGTWRTIEPAPVAVVGGRAAVLGDRVYVTTGCRGSVVCDASPVLLRYDVGADRWTDLGRAPGRGRPVRVGDQVLLLSGTDESGENPDHLYDPARDRWQQLPDDPLPAVYDRFAVDDGDRVLVLGSPVDAGPDAKLAATYDLASGTWSRLPDAPGGGYQVWGSDGRAWLNPHFGNGGGGVLDLGTDTWSAFPEPPQGHEGEPLDLAGLIGGDGATYEYAHGLVLDSRHDRWVRVPERPRPSYDESVAALGSALVVFGGQRWEGNVGELVAETWIWRPE